MLLINDILFTFFIAAISAAFSYMLDFALGYPGKTDVSEVNTKALLFRWSYYLAEKRLENEKIKITRMKRLKSLMAKQSKTATALEKEMSNRDLKIRKFGTARELFTWEEAAGMCIFCTGLWIALIISAIFYFSHNVYLTFFPNYLILFTTPIFAHFILRKI